MMRILPLATLIVLVPGFASADWVTVREHYAFPPTIPESEACQNAEDRAKQKALTEVLGENFSSEDIFRCSEQGDEAECRRNSLIWTFVGGEIRSIRNKMTEVVSVSGNFKQCNVTLDADVKAAVGRPDPNFDIGVRLNNDSYREGEKLSIALEPNQPMSVQVFQWLPYERGNMQIQRLFPNSFDRIDRVDRKFTIPTESASKQYELKAGFPAGQPAGRKLVDEYLMVVATRKPIAFRDSYSLDEFNRVIAEIPLSDRRIVRRAYSIIRGNQ